MESEMIDVVTLEDGIEYEIHDEIIVNNQKYVYLYKYDDVDDFCIRKIQLKDGKEYLVGLQDKEELNLAIKVYMEKYKEDFTN